MRLEEFKKNKPGEKALVVTYKSCAAGFWRELSEFHDCLIPMSSDDDRPPKECLPYFGGMNGSNRYLEATCVICAGLGRFENSEYLNRALAFDFDGAAWEEFVTACSTGTLTTLTNYLMSNQLLTKFLQVTWFS